MQVNENRKTFSVDGTEYKLTSGLKVLIMSKHPRPSQWDSDDYQAYKFLCAQTKVRSFPNPAVAVRPQDTWKYKQLLKKMVVLGERIEEESDDSDDTYTSSIDGISEPSDTDSIGGIDESFDSGITTIACQYPLGESYF